MWPVCAFHAALAWVMAMKAGAVMRACQSAITAASSARSCWTSAAWYPLS